MNKFSAKFFATENEQFVKPNNKDKPTHFQDAYYWYGVWKGSVTKHWLRGSQFLQIVLFRCDSISLHLPLSVGVSVQWVIHSFRLEIAIASLSFASLFIPYLCMLCIFPQFFFVNLCICVFGRPSHPGICNKKRPAVRWQPWLALCTSSLTYDNDDHDLYIREAP